MHILVHAYQVSPNRGSEFSVAWNYIMNMSQKHNLYIICGQSSYNMGDFRELSTYLQNNNLKNVQFFMIKPSKMVQMLNLYHPISFTSPTFYMAYKRWEQEVYHLLKQDTELMNKIDIIHYLGPIGYREPGYLWKFNKPYIWGPAGGFVNMKGVFIKQFKSINKIKFLIKNAVNVLQLHFHFRVRQAMKRADVMLACNTEQQCIVKKYFNRNVEIMPENKITNIPFIEDYKGYINRKYDGLITGKNILEMVWIGTLTYNKMPFMLLDIAERINPYIIIKIIGGGYLQDKIKAEIQKRDLSAKILLTGSIPREQVFSFLEQAHLHIITSAMEANTTVIFEAFSVFTPTITLNHCGMADTVTDSCGIKININNYRQMVDDFAEHINGLMNNPIRLKELSFGCVNRAQELTWDKQKDFWEQWYEIANRVYYQYS